MLRYHLLVTIEPYSNLYQQIRNDTTVFLPYPDILIYHLTEYIYIYTHVKHTIPQQLVGQPISLSSSYQT